MKIIIEDKEAINFMNEDYKKDLLNPDISLEYLTAKYPLPKLLYKYKNFDNNGYWKKAIIGEFHLSRAKDFEDKNDCEPYIDFDQADTYIKKLFNNLEENFISIKDYVSDAQIIKYMDNVKNNFQTKIRIGCFTNSNSNESMWQKYADDSRGFCIEYRPYNNNKLMQKLIHQVVYQNDKYDISKAFVLGLFLEAQNQITQNSFENHIKIYNDHYKLQRDITYKCLYIKQLKWSFENEYRLILPDHIATREGEIKSEEVVYGKDNICLLDAVKAIYLGKNFNSLPNHEEILAEIKEIIKPYDIELKEFHYGNNI